MASNANSMPSNAHINDARCDRELLGMLERSLLPAMNRFFLRHEEHRLRSQQPQDPPHAIQLERYVRRAPGPLHSGMPMALGLGDPAGGFRPRQIGPKMLLTPNMPSLFGIFPYRVPGDGSRHHVRNPPPKPLNPQPYIRFSSPGTKMGSFGLGAAAQGAAQGGGVAMAAARAEDNGGAGAGGGMALGLPNAREGWIGNSLGHGSANGAGNPALGATEG